VLIACVAGGVQARLLGGVLAAALAFTACTLERTPMGLGPPFLRVASVAQTSDVAATSPPAWSPGGEAIAFGTDDGVWKVQADGTGLRRLASLPRVTDVAWSPGGRTVAAAAGDMLFAVHLDGRPPEPVSTIPGARLGAWAPRASRLAYTVPRGDHDVIETWDDGEVDRRSALPAPVRLPDGLVVQTMSWTQDGRELLVALAPRGETSSIRVLRIQMALLHPLVVPIGWHDTMVEAAFDPFARLVAYIGGSPEGTIATHSRVMAARLDGTGRRFLTLSGAYVGLSWAPSGTLVAFGTVLGPDEISIDVVDVATGARLRVADYRPELAEYARSLVTRWAPDGLHLAFGTDTGGGRGPIWMATLERR